MLLLERDVWHLVYDVASALAHCHANRVLHLDIKPDNIFIVLVSHGSQLEPLYKLGDFGNALLQGRGWSAEEGDGAYVAPELLQQESAASAAADIYSLAATIYEVATGQRIPRGEDARRSGVPRPSATNCGEPLAEMLAECLAYDPALRPTAERVVQLADDWLSRAAREEAVADGDGVGLFACSPQHPDRGAGHSDLERMLLCA